MNKAAIRKLCHDWQIAMHVKDADQIELDSFEFTFACELEISINDARSLLWDFEVFSPEYSGLTSLGEHEEAAELLFQHITNTRTESDK